jgi:hypothetical protein
VPLAGISAVPRSGLWRWMSRCRFALSPCCHRMLMCPCRSVRCWRKCTSGRRTPGGLTTHRQCHLPLCVQRCSAGSLLSSHRSQNPWTSETGRRRQGDRCPRAGHTPLTVVRSSRDMVTFPLKSRLAQLAGALCRHDRLKTPDSIVAATLSDEPGRMATTHSIISTNAVVKQVAVACRRTKNCPGEGRVLKVDLYRRASTYGKRPSRAIYCGLGATVLQPPGHCWT